MAKFCFLLALVSSLVAWSLSLGPGVHSTLRRNSGSRNDVSTVMRWMGPGVITHRRAFRPEGRIFGLGHLKYKINDDGGDLRNLVDGFVASTAKNNPPPVPFYGRVDDGRFKYLHRLMSPVEPVALPLKTKPDFDDDYDEMKEDAEEDAPYVVDPSRAMSRAWWAGPAGMPKIYDNGEEEDNEEQVKMEGGGSAVEAAKGSGAKKDLPPPPPMVLRYYMG